MSVSKQMGIGASIDVASCLAGTYTLHSIYQKRAALNVLLHEVSGLVCVTRPYVNCRRLQPQEKRFDPN